MKFSEKLLELRKEKGLTQAELAEKLNVSRQTVSNWELGTAGPNLERLSELSEFFGVPLDVLLGDDAVPPPDLIKNDEEASDPPDNEKTDVSGTKQNYRKLYIFLICFLSLALAVSAVFSLYYYKKYQERKSRYDEVILIGDMKSDYNYTVTGSFDLHLLNGDSAGEEEKSGGQEEASEK